LTFNVSEHHAELGLFKDHVSSVSSFTCGGDDLLNPDEIMEWIDLC